MDGITPSFLNFHIDILVCGIFVCGWFVGFLGGVLCGVFFCLFVFCSPPHPPEPH